MKALDPLDRSLISLLQANARENAANLARKLGVARTTVLARLARLEAQEVIVGYTVRLAQDAQGAALQAYVGITVQPKSGRDVTRRLSRMPEVQQLCAVSGEYDYVAWLRADTPERLDALLDEIGEVDGVVKTTTSIVLAKRIDRMAP